MARTPRVAHETKTTVPAAKPKPPMTNSDPQPVTITKVPSGYMPPRTTDVPK